MREIYNRDGTRQKKKRKNKGAQNNQPQNKDIQNSQNEEEKKKIETIKTFLEEEPITLYNISTPFPFKFLSGSAGELTVDENKINVVYYNFPGNYQIESILYKDIGDIIVETSFFFATLRIIEKHHQDEPIVLRYLDIKKAKQARRILQGMLMLQTQSSENINFSIFNRDELITKLEKLGAAKEIE